MELFELISMFVPVLMVALFIFISIRKAIKNKKSAQDPEKPRRAKKLKNEEQPAADKVHPELRPWLERFPDMARMIPGPEAGEAETKQPAQPAVNKTTRSSPAEGLNVLETPGDYAVESYGPAESGAPSMRNENRQRLSRLPELKKAVIWAEILGKPKGLE